MALVATVGGMLFGFDISSIAALVIRPQYIEYFDNPSGVRQGAIGSALAAGSVFGSLIAGPISDKWGRRDRYSVTLCMSSWPIANKQSLASCLPVSGGFWAQHFRWLSTDLVCLWLVVSLTVSALVSLLLRSLCTWPKLPREYVCQV